MSAASELGRQREEIPGAHSPARLPGLVSSRFGVSDVLKIPDMDLTRVHVCMLTCPPNMYRHMKVLL